MKTLAELMELVQEAIQQSEKERNTWFIRFAGHVNLLEIQYYPTGWDSEKKKRCHEIEAWLNREDEIQLAYWFLKKHL